MKITTVDMRTNSKSVGWVQSLFHRDETHRYPFKMVGYASASPTLLLLYAACDRRQEEDEVPQRAENTVPELLFEKKKLIPELQRILVLYPRAAA